jgi:formylglycine-generating enzyme required for sulfatase activity
MSRLLPVFFLVVVFSSHAEEATPVAVSAAYPAWDGKESVEDYAKRNGLKPSETLDLGDGVKLEMLLVPPGSFMMGSPESEPKRPGDAEMEKLHKVTITQPFYLGKFELTQAQYEKVTGKNPSSVKGDDLPVSDIVWDDAVAFCKAASEKLKRDIRLPTEAQWEYACRAGTQTVYYTGDDDAALDKAGWYSKNSEKKPHPGGQKAPNAFGLFDMIGNVRELCSDFCAPYEAKDTVDPTGPEKGEKHVSRGGAYAALMTVICRCASRTPEPLDRKNAIIGMRAMMALEKK